MTTRRRPDEFLSAAAALLDLIAEVRDAETEAVVRAAADQAEALQLDAEPGLALFGMKHRREVEGGPAATAFVMACLSSWARNGGVKCEHLIAPTVAILVPGAGVMACPLCLPSTYTRERERQRFTNGRCDVCSEPSASYTGHSHQAGPFLINADLCDACHTFTMEA